MSIHPADLRVGGQKVRTIRDLALLCSNCQRWSGEHQPNGGLVKPVCHLLRDSPEARAAAVATLADTYFTGTDPAALLAELGLSDAVDRSPAENAFAALTEGQWQPLARQYQRLRGRADVHWQNLGPEPCMRFL